MSCMNVRTKTAIVASLALAVPTVALAVAPVPYVAVPRGGAVILNTGSTNTLGYRIALGRDGSATYVQPGRAPQRGRLPTAVANKFWSDVRSGMPLSQIHAGTCMKSASFGISLFVWWHGQRSNDLSCPLDDRARGLAADATTIANALGIKTMSSHFVPLPTNEPRHVLTTPTPLATP